MENVQRKRKGKAWWAAQIAAQECSGLTQRVFCTERGLAMSSFSRWRARLRSEEAGHESVVTPSPVRFVEVELPAPSAKPLVRVSLGEVTVDFETLPPPAWIAELATHRALRC